MNSIHKIMLASIMFVGITTVCFARPNNSSHSSQSHEKVNFTNNSGMTVSLTGPRGTRSIENGKTISIPPKTNPVSYTIAASEYPTYSGSAKAGKSYTITIKNKKINVQ